MPFRSNSSQPRKTNPDNKPPVKEPPKPDIRFMTVKEVAKLLRLSPISVYRLADTGQLASYRVLRKRLFKYDEVIAMVERGIIPRWNQ